MAVTANQLITQRAGPRRPIPVIASTRFYQGTLVYTVPASGHATNVIGAGANGFAGIAVGEVDNSAGAAADKNIEVHEQGIFLLVGSGFAQADVGVPVYGTDNFTVVKTRVAAGSVYVGKIVEFVSSTQVYVRIEPRPEQLAAIVDPSGGGTIDSQARTAINSIIDVLEQMGGIIAS
jgi:hypothetical protein